MAGIIGRMTPEARSIGCRRGHLWGWGRVRIRGAEASQRRPCRRAVWPRRPGSPCRSPKCSSASSICPSGRASCVFGLLALGFPLALIFSWVYELTPEGLKREHEVDRNQSITRETGRKINYLIGALAAIAIVMVVAERFFPRAAPIPAATEAASGASPTEAPAQATAKSIAVLPFADMSAGKDQEYFADGLSEELLNLLAKVPELRVIGRTSSFQFKGGTKTCGTSARSSTSRTSWRAACASPATRCASPRS